jgi:hypothetical protein
VEGFGLHVDAAANDILLALLPVDLLLQVLEVGDVTWIGKMDCIVLYCFSLLTKHVIHKIYLMDNILKGPILF